MNKIKGLWRDRSLNSVELDQKLLKDLKQKKFPNWEQIKNFPKVLSQKEQKLFNISILLLLIGIVWMGFNLSDAYSKKVPEVGGRYVEGKVASSPQLINPLFAGLNSTDKDIAQLIYSGLMRYDNGKLQQDLASDYRIKNKGKTYEFTLKKGVTWHDGKEFTADDVVFTYKTIKDKEVNSPHYVTFKDVSVKKTGKYKVEFNLSKPYRFFPHSLTVGILPEHIWANVTPGKMTLSKNNLEPVGTGPYKFKKLAKDSTGYIYEYVLQRNEDFYRRPPYIQNLAFKFYQSYQGSNGAIQALKKQEIDGLSYLPPREKRKTEIDDTHFYELELPQYTALFFNPKESQVLSNKQVRTALGYSVDKNRVLQEAIYGQGRIVRTPILSGLPGSNPQANELSYNVKKANKLLDKNWSRIGDGKYKKLRLDALIKQFGLEDSASTSSRKSFYSEDDPNIDPVYTGRPDANYSSSIVINDYATSTKSREVTLDISGAEIDQIRLSNDTDFSNNKLRNYTQKITWKLTPGNGEKWLFAQLKLKDGEEKVVYDKIQLKEQFLSEKKYTDYDINPDAEEINQVKQVLGEETSGPQTFYRKNEDGEILDLEITTLNNPEYRRAAKLVVNFFKEVGVKADIRYVSKKEMSNQVLKQKNYDILLYRVILGGEADQYPFWHSSQQNYPGLNLSNFSNEKVDKLLEEARQTTDDKKIAEKYNQLQDIILKQHPTIFLYQPQYTYPQAHKIKGFNTKRIFSPAGRLQDARNWYIDTQNEWNFFN